MSKISERLYECLVEAQGLYERFIEQFGRPPTQEEHAMGVTIFIQSNMNEAAQRGNGVRRQGKYGNANTYSGNGGSASGSNNVNRSHGAAPVFKQKPPRGKHTDMTWGDLLEKVPDYVEWALANTDWLSEEDKRVLRNALSHSGNREEDKIPF